MVTAATERDVPDTSGRDATNPEFGMDSEYPIYIRGVEAVPVPGVIRRGGVAAISPRVAASAAGRLAPLT